MSRQRQLGAFLLALALSLPPAAAMAADIAGPQLDAAGLRAARRAAPESQLRLVFDLRRGDAAPVPVVVLLGVDYVDVVERGRETLYDFRLRRRLNLDRDAQLFANFSLYGDVAFRRFELGKRTVLAGMFGEASHGEPPPLALRPFWLESDVGLKSGADPPPAVGEEKTAEGGWRFRVGGETVALFSPASQAVPAELRRSFARFLRLRLPLHPDILAALALDGRLPRRLVLVSVEDGERRPMGLVLKTAGRLQGDYPLPAAFAPRPLAGQSSDAEALSLSGLLPVMLQAVAGRSGDGPRPLEDYRSAAEEALERKEGFAAMLLLAEAALQYGVAAGDCLTGLGWGAACHDAEELGHRFAEDPRAALFYKAQTAEPKDPAAAAAMWESLKRNDVANGYVVDAFLADRLSASGHREDAMGAFSRALAGDPYLAGVYKELGDHFLRASRTDLAWTCYDLGRALPGRNADDSLAGVDALEEELASAFPEFF
ncbi:MAG TPA: hypothetical protein VEI03_19560 [Stellaceae bacterium]|nr:hypothetical protein [Stellaceae bacterium]